MSLLHLEYKDLNLNNTGRKFLNEAEPFQSISLASNGWGRMGLNGRGVVIDYDILGWGNEHEGNF